MGMEQQGRSTGAIVAAVGGALGAVGVFLKWFKVSVDLGEFGEAFGTAGVPTSQSISGTQDWTGMAALIVGLAVVGAAIGAMVSKGPGARTMALLAGIGGIIVLLVSILGFIRASNVAGEAAALGFSADASAALGLYVSAAGGLIAAIGGFMARRQVGMTGAMGMPAPPPPPSQG